MASLTDDIRSVSSEITELGALENQTSIDLSAQSTKFDEAWVGMEKNPEKSLKTLTEQTQKLRLEADEKGNDRARDTARNFESDISELTRLRQEITAARGRRDDATVQRLQDQYASSQNRARTTYEIWRRGDVEQYKLAKEDLKKKQARAADDVQRVIDNLDTSIGKEGNESFTKLRAALSALQGNLKSGQNTGKISLPGAGPFDPKKGNFDRYFESWQRRNRIDETDLRKEKKKTRTDDDEEDEDEDTGEGIDGKRFLETRASRRAKIDEIKADLKAERVQAKAAANAAILSGAAAGIGAATAVIAGTANATADTKAPSTVSAKDRALEKSRLARKSPNETWSAQEVQTQIFDRNPNRQQEKLERFIASGKKLSPEATKYIQSLQADSPSLATTSSISGSQPVPAQTTPTQSGPRGASPVNTPPTQTISGASIERQQLERVVSRREISGALRGQTTEATQELVFTGKIGRRLQKNVEEFEQVKQRIITLEGKITAEGVPDTQVIQQLNIEIEQAITLQQSLNGNIQAQLEYITEQAPDLAPGAAAFAIATVAGAAAFVANAATAQANRAPAAGIPLPNTVRQAQSLSEEQVQGFTKLARNSAAASSVSMRSGGVTAANQGIESDQTLQAMTSLIGDTPLTPEAGEILQTTLNPLQANASDQGKQLAEGLQHRAVLSQKNASPAAASSNGTDAQTESPTEDEAFELPTREEAEAEAPRLQAGMQIARRGGKALRGIMPKQALGGGTGGLGAALALQSQHQADETRQREELSDLLADTGLSDNSSLSDADLEPILALKKKSYTDDQVPDISSPYAGGDTEISGGGILQSDADQAARARQLQQQQQVSQRNFTGGTSADTWLGLSPRNLHDIANKAGLSGLRDDVTENLGGAVAFDRSQANENTQDPETQARNLMSQQMSETRKKATDDVKKKLQEKVKQQIQAMAKKAAQKSATATARVTLEGAQAVAGPEDAGITWVTLIIEMNLQLILKYILKGFGFFTSKMSAEGSYTEDVATEINDFANSIQSFWEDVLTIWMDCCLELAVFAQMCGPPLLIILSFVFIFSSAIIGIAGIMGKT